jgi:hypothetical protein
MTVATMPLIVAMLIGMEGVPANGLLISAVSSTQLSPRATRSASSVAWRSFMSNRRSVVLVIGGVFSQSEMVRTFYPYGYPQHRKA